MDNREAMIATAKVLSQKVDLKNRRFRGILYPNSFLGQDLIKVLLQEDAAMDAIHAHELATELLQRNYIENVFNAKDHENPDNDRYNNDTSLYTFTQRLLRSDSPFEEEKQESEPAPKECTTWHELLHDQIQWENAQKNVLRFKLSPNKENADYLDSVRPLSWENP